MQEWWVNITGIYILKEQRNGFYCVGCGKEMIVVKSEARKKEWHFRHSEETLCTGSRDTALHDYAVQVLMENKGIAISKKLTITYTKPRKEVMVLGKLSDVTVDYESEEVHFEVFVTHDLEQEKVDIYKTNKIKCVRIDLSDPELLTELPEKIKEAVLNQYRNKTIIYWQDEVLKPYAENESDFGWKHVLIGIGVFICLRFLYNRFFKPKRCNLY